MARTDYLADLVRLLVLQQLRSPRYRHLVNSLPDPKDGLVQAQEAMASLATAIHSGDSIETVLSRAGDVLVRMSVLADSIQHRKSVLSVLENDTVRLGEWLLEHAPASLDGAESPVGAALQLLQDMQLPKEKVH